MLGKQLAVEAVPVPPVLQDTIALQVTSKFRALQGLPTWQLEGLRSLLARLAHQAHTPQISLERPSVLDVTLVPIRQQ